MRLRQYYLEQPHFFENNFQFSILNSQFFCIFAKCKKVYLMNSKFFSFDKKSAVKQYAMIVVGSLLFAATDVLFVNPYKLAPGGVYGIANVMYWLFGTKISYVAMSLEIPLLLTGIYFLGPKFGFKTVLSIILIAGGVYTMESTWGYAPVIVDDILISSVVAGVLYGIAVGLIFKAHATSGGTDIISMIVSKYSGMSLGRVVLIVDSAVTLITLIAFQDIRLPIYSLILIFIQSKVIDVVVDGLQTYKTVLIVSNKADEIRKIIIDDLERGGTFLESEGMYSGERKKTIYTVIDRRQFLTLRDEIYTIDPTAFINVLDSTEIMGEGFKQLQKGG